MYIYEYQNNVKCNYNMYMQDEALNSAMTLERQYSIPFLLYYSEIIINKTCTFRDQMHYLCYPESEKVSYITYYNSLLCDCMIWVIRVIFDKKFTNIYINNIFLYYFHNVNHSVMKRF